MKLGCTAGYDIKSQGDNDEKWPFLFFPIFNLCHSSSRHTIWSTVQSQLGNIAGIYHKIAKHIINFRNHTTPLRWFPSNFQWNAVVLIGPGDTNNCDDYWRTATTFKRKTGQFSALKLSVHPGHITAILSNSKTLLDLVFQPGDNCSYIICFSTKPLTFDTGALLLS